MRNAGWRIVLDTNVLVAASYADRSASRRIVAACLAGTLVALVSHELRREYDTILGRAVRNETFRGTLNNLLERMTEITVKSVQRVVPEDRTDDKIVALALAGNAEAIVTNDDHLLQLTDLPGPRVMRPRQYVRWRLEEAA
jgi:putative PIN family toxin of toxin-antitoxin system